MLNFKGVIYSLEELKTVLTKSYETTIEEVSLFINKNFILKEFKQDKQFIDVIINDKIQCIQLLNIKTKI